MATADYFAKIDGKECGPLSSLELKQLVTIGRLKKTDWLKKGVNGQWVSASTASGLFPVDGSAVPPNPQPAISSLRPAVQAVSSKAVQPRALQPVPPTPQPASMPIQNVYHQPVQQLYAQPVTPAAKPPIDRTTCPFCGEEIAAAAVKCRYCNEFLDPRLRSQISGQVAPQQVVYAPAPAAPVNVVVTQNVQAGYVGQAMESISRDALEFFHSGRRPDV